MDRFAGKPSQDTKAYAPRDNQYQQAYAEPPHTAGLEDAKVLY